METFTASTGCDSTVTTITSLVDSYDITTTLYSCNPLDTGYVRTFYASAQGCDSIVTVETLLLPSYESTSTVLICFGDTVDFNGNFITSSGAYSYNHMTSQGCDSIEILNVIIPDELTLSATQEDVSCNGDTTGSIDLTVTGGFPPYSFDWSTGDTTEDLSNLTAGTYTVMVTDANDCEDEIEIIITQPDSLRLSANVTPERCTNNEDGKIDLEITGGVKPYTYSWNSGTYTTQDIHDLPAGTYTVEVTDSLGCTASLTATVGSETTSSGQFPISTDANNICSGETATLTVFGKQTTYQWSFNNNPIVGATDSFLVVSETGWYAIYVTNNISCTEGSDSIEITASDNLVPDINQGGSILCPDGGSITLAADAGFETYEWFFGNDVIPNEDGSVIVIDQEGTYYVEVTNDDGCTGRDSIVAAFDTYEIEPDTVTITVTELTGTTLCLEDEWEFPGDIVSIFICRQPSEVTYDYVIDGGEVCFEFDRLNEEVGVDTLCIIAFDNSVCSFSDTAIIILELIDTDEPPTATEECVEVEENDNVFVEVLLNDTDPDGDELYVSNIVSDPSHGAAIINGDGSTITYVPDNDYCGLDTFYYEVCDIDNNGCDTAFVCIEVRCDCFIPDGFSPNNDGINDYFVIECLEQIDDGLLRVYNRWGTELYRNSNYKNDWDGTYKGEELPEGTYYFTITFTDHDGVEYDGAGALTILR